MSVASIKPCTHIHLNLQNLYQLHLFYSKTFQLLISMKPTWFLMLYQLKLGWQGGHLHYSMTLSY